jgi:bifunctional DNA-binding transcriptional regulator/antitoxin component of YhaV-PrlF toxin-antitoxin module
MDQHVTMAPNGRLVTPAQLRARLGMEAGGTFLAQIDDGGICLVPLREVVSRVRRRPGRHDRGRFGP